MGREGMRAADADRQRVADRLRVALEEGRLDLHEYDERVQQAYAAKTYGDLDGLLTDLPDGRAWQPATPAVTPLPTTGATGNAVGVWVASVWASWFVTAGITTTVWAAISVAQGEFLYFWPFWVAGPWGLVLILVTIGGLANGAPRRMAEERARKELAREHRRERRALITQAIARGELPENPSKEQRRAFVAAATARGELPQRPGKTPRPGAQRPEQVEAPEQEERPEKA